MVFMNTSSKKRAARSVGAYALSLSPTSADSEFADLADSPSTLSPVYASMMSSPLALEKGMIS
jgi:hypothetical protein